MCFLIDFQCFLSTLKSYSTAEQSLPSFAPVYSSRAAAFLKLKKYNQALQVSDVLHEICMNINHDLQLMRPTLLSGIAAVDVHSARERHVSKCLESNSHSITHSVL
jgi:hypothetical protein